MTPAQDMADHTDNMPDARDPGELLILSAPSAAGKTTLKNRLFSHHRSLARRLAFSVSYTTRPPRTGEVDGKDYFFIDTEEFEELIAADAFLEWAVVHGKYYGTGREQVEKLCRDGFDVILDIDVQGAVQVLERNPRVPSIFILPPSYLELERRLRSRGLDDSAQIERRLLTAGEEMRYLKHFDYAIVNDDLERATEALAAILLARRFRRTRMQNQITQLLEGYPRPAGDLPVGS